MSIKVYGFWRSIASFRIRVALKLKALPFEEISIDILQGEQFKPGYDAVNPEHVVPGHGTPGTVKIFEDGEKYYALLLDRVGAMVKAGKSLDDIKKEVKMPEYSSWGNQERFPTNVEAAYKAVAGK